MIGSNSFVWFWAWRSILLFELYDSMIQLKFICYIIDIADDANAADLWLLNSCTVKNPAEDLFRNEITKAKKGGKGLVVAGCVPQAQPRASYTQGVSVIGVQQIDRVVEVVEETLNG